MPNHPAPALQSPATPTYAVAKAPKFTGKGKVQRKRFSEVYLLNYDPIEAAKAADAPFDHEQEYAMAMLQNPQVRDYLGWASDAHEHGLRPTQARIIDELNALALQRPGDAIDRDKDGKITGLRMDKIDPRIVSGITIRDTEFGKHVALKFHPKIDSLKIMAQTTGILAEEGKKPPMITMIFGGTNQVNNNAGGE